MPGGVSLGSAHGEIVISTDQAEQNIQSLADTMRKAGTAMSLGVTAPLVGIAATAIDSAADFEQSLNIMAQVSGATADQMATLQAQALEMGAVTSFSAGEAAQAQLELAKAGLSVNDIISATPGVLDMAAAGGMGLAESAEIAANAMNAFNLPASEMPAIANMLAAAANASSVDIGDLAMAMKMSGAVFAANKQPMDDMVTALAMLGNAGLKGSDAGTSLKTMLLSLASPTDKANKAMNAIGLSVYDASGNMRGFSDIMSDLSGITAKMTDAERNNALSVIFGSDAIRAATIISRDYGTSWDGISDALGNGTAAADVANARMKGVGGAIEYLKGSIDSFLIGAALPYMAVIGNIIRSGADMLTAFSALPQPVMDAAVAFGAVLAAAGPVMLAITGITAAIGFLLSPIGLLVVGIGAVAAGFVLWSQNVGGIQEQVAQLAGNFLSLAEATTGINFTGIIGGLSSFGSYIGAVIEDGDYMNDWLTHLPESIQPATEAFGRFVAAVGDLVQTGDVQKFADELKIAFTSIQTGAGQVQGTLGSFLAQVTAIGAMVAAFFAPAIERLQTAFTALPERLATLMPKLQELGGAFMGLIQSLAPFVALIGGVLAVAADFGINALAAAIDNLPGLIGPIIDQTTATLRLISTVLTEVVTAVKAIIDGDWATAWQSAQTIANEFSTFYRGLFSRLGTFTSAVVTVIYDAVTNTLRDLGVDVDPILNGIKKTFEDIWGGIQSAVQGVIDIVGTVTDTFSNFKEFLDGLELPNPVAPILDAINSALGGLGKLTNWGSGGGADGDPSTPQAIGTSYFRGGTAQLYERGYEQIVLPAGSRIYTNGQTNNLPTSEGKTVNINLGGVTVRSETDARRLGDMLRDQLVMAGA